VPLFGKQADCYAADSGSVARSEVAGCGSPRRVPPSVDVSKTVVFGMAFDPTKNRAVDKLPRSLSEASRKMLMRA
jgi:hypothetical protein